MERKLFGVQFHPEVTHSLHGKEILRNFAVEVCRSSCDWNMAHIAEEFIRDVSGKGAENRHIETHMFLCNESAGRVQVRDLVGPENNVIGAVSGGVDSSVAAVLLHRCVVTD